MILEDARQATAAAKRMLATVRDGAADLGELREALEQSQVFMAAGVAFQTAAAELIAARERHGDGGIEILAASAGLSQREAQSHVKTAAALRQVPRLSDAVQSGDVSQANARRLADAINKTGAGAVAGDDVLLRQAESMRPEQFAKTAQRWVSAQQADDGTSEYLRQRARRFLTIYDTEEGMVCLRGEFDKITGTRIHNRLRHTATRLLNADKKLPEGERRKFPQCMADALQHHTATTATTSTSSGGEGSPDGRVCESGGEGFAGSCVCESGGEGFAGSCVCESGGESSASGSAGCGGFTSTVSTDDSDGAASGSALAGIGVDATSGCASTDSCVADDVGSDAASKSAGGGWLADITLVAHVDDTTGALIAELSDGTKLPAGVLEELSCNARWTGLVYDRAGDAIWRSRSRRTVTETQCRHCLLATEAAFTAAHLRACAKLITSPLFTRWCHQFGESDHGVLELPPQDPSPQMAYRMPL